MNDKFSFKNLKDSDKKQIMSLVLVICLVGIVLLGTSYAWLTVTKSSTNSIGITAGTLNLQFSDTESSTITLTDNVPISDSEGLASTPYTFTITNKGNVKSNYTIYLDDVNLDSGETKLDDKYVKYSLTKNSGTATTALINSLTPVSNSTSLQLTTGTLETENSQDTYTLRVWLDEDNFNKEATSKTFKKTLRIEATQEFK